MINHIAPTRVHAADNAALRENPAKKTEPAKNPAAETGDTKKTARPAHPHGHVPPGLERAAERISSKIFARADTDGSGTITLQELGAIHSAHARSLASTDLFRTATPETPTDVGTDTTRDIAADTTAETTDIATDVTAETTSDTPSPAGITEAQLREALTKSFYAKVGVIYTSPEPAATKPDSTASANPTTPSAVDLVSDVPETGLSFTALA